MEQHPLVLVVDDEDRNRRLVQALLAPHGYRIVLAKNGEEALALVAEASPDVILLDVMMPKLNGFTVCRELKANKATAPIPILLVTNLADRDSRIRGIQCGANDFVSKPIDPEDLLLRVRNAASWMGLYKELKENHKRLVDLEGLKDDLVHMIAHDIKSPINVIMICLELIELAAPERLSDEQYLYLGEAEEATERILHMIESFLDVSRLESGQMPLSLEKQDIATVISEALASIKAITVRKRIAWNPPNVEIPCRCDRAVIVRVVVNLVTNAFKFSDGQAPIHIELEQAGDCARVSVADQGPGISRQHQRRIFDKFASVQANREGVKASGGSGVGLAFCKLAIEAHGGRIGVDSREGEGSVFWFELPTAGYVNHKPKLGQEANDCCSLEAE